jgi:sirohydrochlorin cobaltochelatase
MKTVIVLVMHGAPPRDFPRPRLGEFFSLHARLSQAAGAEKQALLARFEPLEREVRGWPRTPDNDPFYAFSDELARELAEITGNEVIVGYNEFCAPDVQAAFEKAVERGAGRIAVVTPMMTRGGEHAEIEIPALISEFGSHHPEIEIKYAWPFEKGEIAAFLTQHLLRFS